MKEFLALFFGSGADQRRFFHQVPERGFDLPAENGILSDKEVYDIICQESFGAGVPGNENCIIAQQNFVE